jgi:hypothetical protein
VYLKHIDYKGSSMQIGINSVVEVFTLPQEIVSIQGCGFKYSGCVQ